MTALKHVDTILSPKWILPIHPSSETLEDCSIIIQNGQIATIKPTASVKHSFTCENHLQLSNHAVMPGLVNAHGHAAMTLLRGLADDMPLMEWLNEHIWPSESRWVSEHFVKDGTEIAAAEMLKSGTTCFSDMYFFPDVTAQVVHDLGMRAQICFPVLDFPTPWAKDSDEYLHKGLKLFDNFKTHDRITIAFGPHAPYTVSNKPLHEITTLSNQLNAAVQIHLHETAQEVEDSIRNFGVRPIKRLEEIGLLGPNTQCVHLTQLSKEDIDTLSLTGASAIHCPESNMKLASGTSPASRLLKAGVRVGLGTDGAASNNDLNMFGEMFSAAMLAKLHDNNAASMNAIDTLHMATLGGAEVLGLDHLIGSIEPGKQADLIAIDVNQLNCYPLYNLLSTLVYNNRHLKVTHAWVNGRLLMENEKLLHLNEAHLISKAKSWQTKICGKKNHESH